MAQTGLPDSMRMWIESERLQLSKSKPDPFNPSKENSVAPILVKQPTLLITVEMIKYISKIKFNSRS